MSFGSVPNRDDYNDYMKNFRERFNQIKKSQAAINSSSANSLSKIAEFRKKLEKSFNNRSEQSSNIIEDESFKSYTRGLVAEIKKTPVSPKNQEPGAFSKNNIGGYSFTQKQRLEEIIPLSTLVQAKNALISAPEEIVKELPYPYTLALTKLSKSFIEKYEKFG